METEEKESIKRKQRPRKKTDHGEQPLTGLSEEEAEKTLSDAQNGVLHSAVLALHWQCVGKTPPAKRH